jgi:hypothetical protein
MNLLYVAVEAVQKTKKKTIDFMLAKQKGIFLLEVNLRKKSQLKPKAAKLYTIANEYRSIAPRLTNEVVTNKDRIKEAIKTAESGEIFQ